MHSIKEHFLSPQRVRKEKSYIDYYKYLTPKGNKTKYQFYGDESRIYIPKIQVIGVDNEKREEVKRGLNIRSMSTTDDVPPKILTATISQGNLGDLTNTNILPAISSPKYEKPQFSTKNNPRHHASFIERIGIMYENSMPERKGSELPTVENSGKKIFHRRYNSLAETGVDTLYSHKLRSKQRETNRTNKMIESALRVLPGKDIIKCKKNGLSVYQISRIIKDCKEIAINYQRKQLAEIKQTQLLQRIRKHRHKSVWERIKEGKLNVESDSSESEIESVVGGKYKITEVAKKRRWGFLATNSSVPFLSSFVNPPITREETLEEKGYQFDMTSLLDSHDYNDDNGITETLISVYRNANTTNSRKEKLKIDKMKRQIFIRKIDHTIQKPT